MSETKWTPGPLDVDLEDFESGDDMFICRDGARVAGVYGTGWFPCFDEEEPGAVERFEVEQKANATLYSAAPDLYEALDNAVRNFGGRSDDGTWEEEARAALAKARGESHA